MKYLLLGAAISCLHFNSFCQDTQDSTTKKQPNTNLEKVNLKVGTIIRKEFIQLFRYEGRAFVYTGNFNTRILKLKDALTGIETTGLIFSTYSLGSKYTSGRTYTAYVDADEIPSLLNFFDFIESLKDKTENNYTEYIFNSKDLQFYAYYSAKDKKPAWYYGLEIDKYYSGSRIELQLNTIVELREAIKNQINHFKAETAVLPTSKG